MAEQIIITSQAEAPVIALNEIQKIDPRARGKRLSQEIQLVNVSVGADALREAGFIFIRHIFPVQLILPMKGENIAQALSALARGFPKEKAFSVQMRCTNHNDRQQAISILKSTEDELLGQGFVKNDSQPIWALSFLIHDNELYAGASFTSDNLSDWNGGMHRLKKEKGFISRAEFKLQEAFSAFAIDIPGMVERGTKAALDLGAAPGGWTRVLLDLGFHVTAIDPAALSDELSNRANLNHIRDVAQLVLQAQRLKKQSYDILLNDMRMDMMESCKIMLDMAGLIVPNGLAIISLKLPRSHWYKNTARALSLLEKSYTVQAARQLFHNRSEVTVVMRRK